VNHLKASDISYFKHLARAWKIAAVLLVHGVFPIIWESKASDLMKEISKD
jgi:hypothetical protein